MFFLLKNKESTQITGNLGGVNSNIFLENCLEDSIKEAVNLISINGGHINPELTKEFKFDEEELKNISYLCYNQNDYEKCVNQEPMFFEHLKDEIKEYIQEDIKDCFDNLAFSLDKEGFVVVPDYNGFEVNFDEKKVDININGKIILTKAGKTLTQENFLVSVLTNLYGLAIVVQEIVNKEAEECNFDYSEFILLYPNFQIKKTKVLDNSIIYQVTHKESLEKFRFAIRGCVIPAGD